METQYRYSHCPYNCWPVNCGLQFSVDGEQIQSVQGNPFHDVSRGMLCVKGQSCLEIHRSPHRLTKPLRRVGSRGSQNWKEISWDEALTEIADQLNEAIQAGKPQRNALYHGHGNIVQRANWKILTPRFANMLGMTLWDANFPCWYDVGVAQDLTGYWGLHDPTEMGALSSGLINWAQDPCASMANMTPYMVQLKERGGKIITIDPRLTQTAALSDYHIRPRLGSDAILAHGLAAALIEAGAVDIRFIQDYSTGYEDYLEHVSSVSVEDACGACELSHAEFDLLLDTYANTKPLCLNLTRGALGKHWNGVNMIRAILHLTALTGNIGIPGGGVIWGESIEFNQKLDASNQINSHHLQPPNNYNSILGALENQNVRTLMVVGGNPLSQWPDINHLKSQLLKLDFIVSYDLFLNHTARQVADLVLPATSWIEELGFRSTNRRIYLSDRIEEPLGQCKEASTWMRELSLKLGIADYFPWEDKEACLNSCLDSESCEGATIELLRQSLAGLPANIPQVPFEDMQFLSPSGKYEFTSEKATELGLDRLPIHREPAENPANCAKYPLQLISSRKNTHFHSFHMSHLYVPTLLELEPEPVLHVHPFDANQRGINDGSMAQLFNDRGSVVLRVEWSTEVQKGHVSLNDCWPELNILTDSRTPVSPEVTSKLGCGGQPSYQNCLVELRSLP